MNENPFASKPIAKSLYDQLVARIREVGPSMEEFKKTSVHIVAGKGAFLGVHPRMDSLLLNIVLDHPLVSTRLKKTEQVSGSRYHNEVKVADGDEIDDELIGWITDAYRLKTS